ncbi:MAG: malto-oligosyltrehalose trehalohydrolase [Myxococcaceae bacterium]|nr:malto-oligosyltrehalose trehalohydrolase [Myxococcaceae bacterium]
MLSRMQELGAVPDGDGRVRFSVWAPKRKRVDVVLDGRDFPLEPGPDGMFSALLKAEPGQRYTLKVDGGDAFPDPCSRFQPEGPHGPSEVVDPSRYRWGDADWKGAGPHGHVIYELHVGAFTKEGTYAALTERLPYLKELGVTLLELMPLHDCPGTFNWGYDGVALFAPNHNYGTPDDLRRLVDRAHALGLGVILDVVYNHLGPDGNYLGQFAEYHTHKYPDEWGAPLDFDGENAKHVRRFVTANAAAWVSEYHLDGLRLDATQNLFDASEEHIVKSIARAARDAAGGRSVFLTGESERQDAKLLDDGLDAIWVDDFHHVGRVIASGGAEGYMQDYEGSVRELVACVLRNSIYQGQYYAWQKHPRGTPLRQVPHERAIFALQNHDQIANSLDGRRLHALGGDSLTRALTSFFLLAPQTPMLFMGQEYFAPQPFYFFVDHGDELAQAIAKGRRDFLSQFVTARNAIYEEGAQPPLGRPAFDASRLDLSQAKDSAALRFHQELLALRRRIVKHDAHFDAAVLGAASCCLRWPDHLVVLDFANDRQLNVPSEPLLAPPPGMKWKLAFSSELSRFGGRGAFASDGLGPWRVQGRACTVLETTPR